MSKWLILQGPEQLGGDDEARREDTRRAPAAPRRRAAQIPIGSSGLPSDWLFSMAAEPVIIVETTTRRVIQANPAAAELLGAALDHLIGRPLADTFHASSAEALDRGLDVTGSAQGTTVVDCRSAAEAELRAVMSWFRADADHYVLIRLAGPNGELGKPRATLSPVFDAVDNASVGFLLTDADFRIEYANQAFLDLIESMDFEEIRGQPLARWLQMSDADRARLKNQMLQRQATSVMAVRLATEGRKPPDVEVCAVAVPDGQTLCWGFTVSELPRLN